MVKIRDRVKELVRVPAGELVPSPQNWRTHSTKQRRALRVGFRFGLSLNIHIPPTGV